MTITVKLLSWSNGHVKDPRRLVLLAIKMSSGKLREKRVDHYLTDYPDDKVKSWLIKAVDFPSVLEHISFTFLIDGISRVTSHQLVRHRLASYTQESQRYSVVDEEFVIPPTINESSLREKYVNLIKETFKFYKELLNAGVPPEDARYILPQAVKTRLIMTVNLRELIHIACLRLSKLAQWEIRDMVRLMINEASKVIPEIQELVRSACHEDIVGD